MSTNSILRWIFSTLMVASSLSHALPEDREQPIRIKADFADINEGTGLAIYTGNVIMTQGTILISGSEVTIYSNDAGVTRMVAKGSPAHYKEKPSVDKEIVKAYGNTIDYSVTTEEIKLLKNAKLYQQENSFLGDTIHYNMKTQIVNAQSAPAKGGSSNRVEMIIQPKTKK